jgi:serine/threonine protein kinase/tetratricopeptide (TPR) repeat protein
MLLPTLAEVQRAVADRYEVLDLLGAGGMGAVFRGRHRELGHMVAIKVLPYDAGASAMRQARFKREASLAANLSHPNIVPVVEFDAKDELAYLIMPLVRGQTLQDLMRARGRLSLREIRQVLTQMLQALHFAHQRGIVHRDVKPSNILLEEESGRALLTDFGVAHVQRSDDLLTSPGAAIGTPDYMAPEQRHNVEQVDGRADLYSLALLAYEALTGTRPNAGADRQVLARILWSSHPEVTSEVAAALVLPLVETPDPRPATALAWLEALEIAERRGRRPWRVALISAAAAAIAVAGWLTLGRPAPTAQAPSLAVMPFTTVGRADLASDQLTEFFATRFTGLPNLRALSAPAVLASARQRYGDRPLGTAEADSLAAALGARFFLQGSAAFNGPRVTLTVSLFEAGHAGSRSTAEASGAADSLSALMDAAWAEALRPVAGEGFAATSTVTLPASLPALVAYADGESAFRRGDHRRAFEQYDRVIALDPDFAIAHFRRVLVIAQVDPDERRFQEALAGARRNQRGLSPADSLLVDGYLTLVVRGDGQEALSRFQRAADLAPDQPMVWFVLGEFYYHFGTLFDQPIGEAERAFRQVVDLVPEFAPAIAHLISLAHLRGDVTATRTLIRQYQSLDSTSVVAEAVGIADTMLFGGPAAQRRLIYQTLDRHSFTALAYLAFQAAEFGSKDQREGPARRILAALERRALTDAQRTLALRLGVAADLRAGWPDSARRRLNAPGSAPWALVERDTWILLARMTGLDSLGDWRAARGRLEGRTDLEGERALVVHWLLSHRAALNRDSPLAASLLLDLDARQALARGDTAAALDRWNRATRRYAVLSVPFGLAASLWPIRLEQVRIAALPQACASFSTLMGYVDQVVLPEVERRCRPPESSASARP